MVIRWVYHVTSYQFMQPRYTTILHDVREKLGISVTEYVVADSIDKLSNKPDFKWCTASRSTLASFVGLTDRGVIKLINRLVELKLIERNKDNKLRTTKKWHAEIVLKQEVSSELSSGVSLNKVQGGVNKVHGSPELSSGGSELSSDNNNNYNNTYINTYNSNHNTRGDAWHQAWEKVLGYPITQYVKESKEMAVTLEKSHGEPSLKEALAVLRHAKGNRWYKNEKVKEISNFSHLSWHWDKLQDYKTTEYLKRETRIIENSNPEPHIKKGVPRV